MDNIDDKVLVAPSIEVFGEGPRFADGGAGDVACTEDRLINNIECSGCVAGECECQEIDLTRISG